MDKPDIISHRLTENTFCTSQHNKQKTKLLKKLHHLKWHDWTLLRYNNTWWLLLHRLKVLAMRRLTYLSFQKLFSLYCAVSPFLSALCRIHLFNVCIHTVNLPLGYLTDYSPSPSHSDLKMESHLTTFLLFIVFFFIKDILKIRNRRTSCLRRLCFTFCILNLHTSMQPSSTECRYLAVWQLLTVHLNWFHLKLIHKGFSKAISLTWWSIVQVHVLFFLPKNVMVKNSTLIL